MTEYLSWKMELLLNSMNQKFLWRTLKLINYNNFLFSDLLVSSTNDIEFKTKMTLGFDNEENHDDEDNDANIGSLAQSLSQLSSNQDSSSDYSQPSPSKIVKLDLTDKQKEDILIF